MSSDVKITTRDYQEIREHSALNFRRGVPYQAVRARAHAVAARRRAKVWRLQPAWCRLRQWACPISADAAARAEPPRTRLGTLQPRQRRNPIRPRAEGIRRHFEFLRAVPGPQHRKI